MCEKYFHGLITHYGVVHVGRYLGACSHAVAVGVGAHKAVRMLWLVECVNESRIDEAAECGLIVIKIAAISQHAFPQLHSDYAEYEEDKKAEQEHVA